MEERLSSPEDLESDFESESEQHESESNIEASSAVEEPEVETLTQQLPVSSSRTSFTRSGPGSPHSSSTDTEDTSRSRGLVKRRKKRKRVSVSSSEKFVNNKSSVIEDALKICDKDKLSQLAVSEGGLLCDEVSILYLCVSILNAFSILIVLAAADQSVAETAGNQLT